MNVMLMLVGGVVLIRSGLFWEEEYCLILLFVIIVM